MVKRILNSKINVDGAEVDAPIRRRRRRPRLGPILTPPKAAIPEQPKAPAIPAKAGAGSLGGNTAGLKPGGYAVTKGITEAVAKPAAPPPSTRPVVVASPEPDEETTEGAVPEDLTSMFDDLINKQ